MKKKNMICINEKKSYLVGGILSFVFSVILSFASSSLIISNFKISDKIAVSELGIFLLPIFLVIFFLFVLVFVTICKAINK